MRANGRIGNGTEGIKGVSDHLRTTLENIVLTHRKETKEGAGC
jgi:hypothetical protein